VVQILASFPRITNHLHDVGSGMSFPQVCECSDDIDRVVKLPGVCAFGSLASDWVGSLLAVQLGILTPAPSLCVIDEGARATMTVAIRAKAEVGLAFGTNHIVPATNVLGLSSIVECGNHQELLSQLLALDSWIGTADRMRPDFGRNLLVDREDRKPRLMAIDFGMAFPGLSHRSSAPALKSSYPKRCVTSGSVIFWPTASSKPPSQKSRTCRIRRSSKPSGSYQSRGSLKWPGRTWYDSC
jgi:hypothetical protein